MASQLIAPDTNVARAEQDEARPRFTCVLEDYPDHLVPERYLTAETFPRGHDRALVVNPDLLLARLEDLPVGIVDPSLLDNFTPNEELAWVPQGGAGAMVPFWLGRELALTVSDLVAGRQKVENLAPSRIAVLEAARILISKNNPDVGDTERTAGALALFRERGYAPISGLVHPFHLAALRRYYRKVIRKGGMQFGDQQSERRYVAHNERVARLFHHQLAATISAIVGEPVKPSYVYVASYQSGAKLEKHTDREQCRFTLSLCLDYSPEPRLHTPWPLQLHTPSAMVTVFQGLGDGVIYRGCDIPHSREVLPRGHTSTSIFFHYVSWDFEGCLD